MEIYYESELYHHGIKGMKWGVRRYQNKDGSLTDKGRKRYDRDIQQNLSKKKDARIDTSKPDPDRWVHEDLERSKRVVDTSSDMVRQFKTMERETAPKSHKKRMDLSNMSNKELQDAINREQLERRYNDLFAPEEKPKISKGREITRDALEIAGGVLAVGSSALGIALSIRELKKGR